MTPKAEKIVEFITGAINELFSELQDDYPGLNIRLTVEYVPDVENVLHGLSRRPGEHPDRQLL